MGDKLKYSALSGGLILALLALLGVELTEDNIDDWIPPTDVNLAATIPQTCTSCSFDIELYNAGNKALNVSEIFSNEVVKAKYRNLKTDTEHEIVRKEKVIESVSYTYKDVVKSYSCNHTVGYSDGVASCSTWNSTNGTWVPIFKRSYDSIEGNTIYWTEEEVDKEIVKKTKVRSFEVPENKIQNFKVELDKTLWEPGTFLTVTFSGEISRGTVVDVIPIAAGFSFEAAQVWNSSEWSTIATPNITFESTAPDDSSQLHWISKYKQPDDLTGCVYGFDAIESSTPAVNLCENINGTWLNNVAKTTAPLGIDDSWTFDGVNDAIKISASALPLNDFTYSYWVYARSTAGTPYLFGGSNAGGSWGYIHALTTDTNLQIIQRGVAGCNINYDFPGLNEWVQVTATHTSDAQELYINGISLGNDTTAACKANLNPTTWFDIGGFWHNTADVLQDFNGMVAAFYIWNYSMTDEQVADNYVHYMSTDLMNASQDCSDCEWYDANSSTTVPFMIIANSHMGIYDSYIPGAACTVWEADDADGGLQYWYPLNDSATMQEECESDDGAYTGSPPVGDSVWNFGDAIDLDGATDYADTAISTADLGWVDGAPFSILVWLRPDDVSTHTEFMSVFTNPGAYFRLKINADSTFGGDFYDGAAAGDLDGGLAVLNTWTYLAYTFDGTDDWKLYQDGQLVGTDTQAIGSLAGITGDIRIGADEVTGGDKLEGGIANAMFFNYTLTQEEVNRFAGIEAHYVPVPHYNITTNSTPNIKVSTNGTITEDTNDDVNDNMWFLLPFEPGLVNARFLDYSGEGNDITTVSNALFTVDGTCDKSNRGVTGNLGCYYFDGVSDYIETDLSDDIADGQAFSIEFWGYTTAAQPQQAKPITIDRGDAPLDYIIILKQTAGHARPNKYEIQIYDGTATCVATTTTVPAYNEWTHIVATFDGTDNCSIYYNGAWEDDGTQALGAINVGAAKWRLGDSTRFAGAQEFTGYLDDVILYNISLTPDQVAGRYNSGIQNPDWWNATAAEVPAVYKTIIGISDYSKVNSLLKSAFSKIMGISITD